ncbi:proline-rich proteoglycan 2-like [Grus americana]|uniref:proline-rich proteoglycan 2-like n=1 Tax=Grus americana TaxID=9117 RepID=UPI002407DB37|nr:proline-rich proteoglycan 2-like [Grus americana]
MADERSRLRSYSITPACLHVSGVGTAPRTLGKRLLLPPSPEASPPAEERRHAPDRAGNQAYFPRSFTISKKEPKPRPIPLKVSVFSPPLLAASRSREGGADPLSPSAARRDPLCSHGEGCGCISAHLSPPPGGLHRAPPAPHHRNDTTPGHPDKGGARSAGRREARPLLGGSSREGTRLASAGESAAEALPHAWGRRSSSSACLPPRLSTAPGRQPPARPGLLPQVSARRRGGRTRRSSPGERLSHSALPAPPPPRSPARGSSAPLRLLPVPAAGCGREPRAGGPPPPPRRGSRPLPPAGTNGSAGSRHKGESLQLPVWAPGPPRHAPRRTGHAPHPPSVAGPGAATPPVRRAPDHRGGPPGPEIASVLNSTAFLSKPPKLLPCPLPQAPVELHDKPRQCCCSSLP